MIDAPAFSCMCKFMCIIQIALETQRSTWRLITTCLMKRARCELSYFYICWLIAHLPLTSSLSLSAYSVGEIQSWVSLWARLDQKEKKPTCCCHSLYMYPSRSVYQSVMSVCGLGKVMIFINLFFLCMITWAGGTMMRWHFIACLYICLIIHFIFIVLSC